MNNLDTFASFTLNALAPAASSQPQTMSSREIAELTGKMHKHVLQDIRNMLEQLGRTSDEFSADPLDAYGRAQPGFALPKDLTITLVSGYSVPMRHRIVTRWMELEAKARVGISALPPHAQGLRR